jgi:hypothetical protein
MAFAPRFQEASDSLIVDNYLTIIQRDAKPALDYYYLADNLPDFALRTLGQFVRGPWPTIAVAPRRNTSLETGDGNWIDETLRVAGVMAVVDTDPAEVTRLAMKYMRAVKSITRSASVADWSAGFPANTLFSVVPDITYEYGEIGKNGEGFEKIVTIDLTLKFNER